jgi:hypothetical protein
MRFAVVIVLLAALGVAPSNVAQAGEPRRAQAVETDRAFSGPGWRFRDVENFREQFVRDQRRFRRQGGQQSIVVVPQVVVVSPGRCWQDGYWSYQWVPQSYPYSTWVPGQWSPDGLWIEGHYQQAWYEGGYYQPFWVEGYWTRC